MIGMSLSTSRQEDQRRNDRSQCFNESHSQRVQLNRRKDAALFARSARIRKRKKAEEAWLEQGANLDKLGPKRREPVQHTFCSSNSI